MQADNASALLGLCDRTEHEVAGVEAGRWTKRVTQGCVLRALAGAGENRFANRNEQVVGGEGLSATRLHSLQQLSGEDRMALRAGVGDRFVAAAGHKGA